jgi:cell division protein FtsQ
VSRTGTTTRDRTRGRAMPAGTPRSPVRAPASPSRPRRWQRRRGKRHPLLLAALIPLLLATVAWVLWASPLLAVRAVQVDGVRTLTAAEVRDAAGLTSGTPLLTVDVGAAAARVRRLPQVASAQVTRGWPDRVVVTVRERVAVAVLDRDGQRTLADASGVLFETVTGDPPRGVIPLDVPEPGPQDPATTAGLAAIAALPASVRGHVSQVTATSGEDVTLHLADGTRVVWGNGEQSAAKAAALAALLDQIAKDALKGAGTIDVSAPDAVVLR